MTAGPRRDEHLAALLRELEVPDHGPRFWEELDDALAAEEMAPPQAERWPPRPERRRARWALAGASAAVLALTLALLLPGGPTERALVDEVRARVQAAVTELRTLQGKIVSRSYHPNPIIGELRTERFSFSLTAAGDLRLEEQDGPELIVYDASTGIERGYQESASLGFGRFAVESHGLAPGPPDTGPAERFLERRLGAALASLLAAEDPRLREVTFRGREAWRLVVSLGRSRGKADPDRLELTIDRETGLPLRVLYTREGALLSELVLSDLVADRPLPPRTFRLRFPPGARVESVDEGFRRLPLARAAERVGYAPLVPEAVPPGYRLAEVAVAERAARTGGIEPNPPYRALLNPPSREVVSISYRRGFQQLIVTTRLREVGGQRWRDPFPPAETARPLGSEWITLAEGPLADAEVELVTGALTVPHLWGLAAGLVVTVSGDLGREELVDVAESLRPLGG